MGFLGWASHYTSGLEDSVSQHIALTYNLGGLKCLVQVEADACWWDCSSDAATSFGDAAPSSGALAIRRSGQEIPRSSLMVVKIHRVHKQPIFESQAYFSHISQLYEGLSFDGNLLDKVSKDRSRNTENDLAAWEKVNQANLCRTVEFLKMLMEKARASTDGRLALVLERVPEDEVKVKATLYTKSFRRRLVPEGMVSAWKGWMRAARAFGSNCPQRLIMRYFYFVESS